MPPYFFHLAFELLKQPTPIPGTDCEEAAAAAAIPSPSHEAAAAKSEESTFSPKPNLDIFQAPLPAHSASSWASYIAPKKALRRSLSRPGVFRQSSTSLSRQADADADTNTDADVNVDSKLSAGDAFGADTVRDLRTSEEGARERPARDWRYDRVCVESIDMQKTPAVTQEDVGDGSDQREEQENTQQHAHGHGGLALKGRYVPSNPKTTEFGWGVVHLYRDKKRAGELVEASSRKGEAQVDEYEQISDDAAFVDHESTTLCILAVPSYMMPSDLLGWLGESTRESVSHFRLVRTGRSNKYMVLMKFRETAAARKWQKEWNGKLFNSTEPENCHVVFVKSIRFEAPDTSRDATSFPDMTNDPFTPSIKPNPALSSKTPITSDTARHGTASLTSKPAPPPTPSLVELPTCPVCLERMDETTGLATIFCQHVFHCACLQKWRGSGCPVCRYTQNDPVSKARGASHDTADNECKECGATDNLWICLICGHVGCGRYDEAHAFAHYEKSLHSFAMDVTTQHIWDYTGDEYVHRLIQNKSDGKLVELPSASHESEDVRGDGMLPREKMDNMSLEYTYLLTSQLDSQRLYFEEQVDRAVDKASEAGAAAEQASTMAAKVSEQLSGLQRAHDALVNETLPSVERAKERSERRAEKFERAARSMEKEWREKEVINESLMDRIGHLEKQINEVTIKNSDLEEQNRDLSFFISGMEKLKNSGEEVQEGTLSVAEAPSNSGKKKKGKGKK